MKCSVRLAVLLGMMPLSVLAIEPGPASQYQQETERWLQLQVSGQAQSKERQVATPAERERSLQRWLDSYTHPIPEYYKQDEGGKAKHH